MDILCSVVVSLISFLGRILLPPSLLCISSVLPSAPPRTFLFFLTPLPPVQLPLPVSSAPASVPYRETGKWFDVNDVMLFNSKQQLNVTAVRGEYFQKAKMLCNTWPQAFPTLTLSPLLYLQHHQQQKTIQGLRLGSHGLGAKPEVGGFKHPL